MKEIKKRQLQVVRTPGRGLRISFGVERPYRSFEIPFSAAQRLHALLETILYSSRETELISRWIEDDED